MSRPFQLPPRVSLCLVVKNEEGNLPTCLGSVAGLADEIIVVDTGSADRTKEVAARFGARVFDFAWCDSFALARNESLRYATGRWIFWMDADDSLDELNRGRLRNLLAHLPEEPAAFVMEWRCLPDPATGAVAVLDHLRLFPRHPEVCWRYRVHEQVMPAVRRLGWPVHRSEVVIHHRGYLDPALRARKAERNRRLLELDVAEHPDDPFLLFNLGAAEARAGRPAEAVGLLRRSLERSEVRDSSRPGAYALLAWCLARLGRPDEALRTCRAGREESPGHAELLFQEGIFLHERGDLAGAEGCFRRALQAPEKFSAVLELGPEGVLIRHRLASVYCQQGRHAEAMSEWRAVVALCPQFLPAWLGLGEAQLARGAWAEFQGVLQELEARFPGRPEGKLLQARARITRREFPRARRLLEEILAREARSVPARLLLAEMLLRQGRDREAGRHLRGVLQQEPHHPEARKLLGFLTAQGERGRGPDRRSP